jgi:hypothetical protein
MLPITSEKKRVNCCGINLIMWHRVVGASKAKKIIQFVVVIWKM